MPSTDTDQSSLQGTSGNSGSELKYEETLMYGKYKNKLGEYAKDAAQRLHAESLRVTREKTPLTTSENKQTKCKNCLTKVKEWILHHLGGDYFFLLILGISMALLSFALDYSIHACEKAHYYLYRELKGYIFLQYLTWVAFPLIFITFAVGFVHIVSPQAIGSGIPEMKTILKGVVLREYLTLRVLIAKSIGLVASLGSRLPIGKEGPFVHIASIVAELLNDLFILCKARLRADGYRNEMLAAACAIGVACNFAAPIGGVLFSIEVTATYFAVRDYWRGFFGAVCGAFAFRLLAVWKNEEETITALFKTNFRLEFPYDLQEFIGFTAIGITCGFAGALFVWLHKVIVNFHRKNEFINSCLSRSRFIYPAIVTIVISSIEFPGGTGQFMAGELTLQEAVDTLFDNKTWNTLGYIDESEVLSDVQDGWQNPAVNIYITLVIFIVVNFITTAYAITLPVPAGVFMPVFVIGAAFGRLVGEIMSAMYPNGFVSLSTDQVFLVVPGGYAVVGAASLSGAVTHTVSTAVIVFELTGQISHILPVMIAVLISNLIAQRLQPSIYDSIIEIKELPFLPDITTGKRQLKKIFVEDFMIRSVKFLSLSSTYRDVKILLAECPVRSFPLVKSPDDMVLIGSVSRPSLEALLKEVFSDWPPDSESGRKKSSNISDSNSLKEVLSDTSLAAKNGIFAAHSAEADLKEITINGDLKKSESESSKLERNEELENLLIDFERCKVDPAPFQIIEKTSIHMVHSMFSLLGVTRAYVTSIGRLVGLVSINELRIAIEATTTTSKTKSKKPKTLKKVFKKAKYGTRAEELHFVALQQDESSNDSN